jgi:hypothetical protein
MTLGESRRARDLGAIECLAKVGYNQYQVSCPVGSTHLAVHYVEALARFCLVLRFLRNWWPEEDRETSKLPVSVGDLLDTGARQNITRPWIHRRQNPDKSLYVILKSSLVCVLELGDGLDQYSLVCVQSDGFGDGRMPDFCGQAKGDSR